MNRPRLSLSMIAGNESDVLARCLDSARPFVDEIVIGCNGDAETEQIARDYGAIVYRDTWDADFARARQASLDRCTGDWILWLDADEWLERSTAANLRQLIARPCVFPTVYSLEIRNFDDTEGLVIWMSSWRGSLFPHHPDIRWIRPVHEQVAYIPDPDRFHDVLTSEVILWHDGYLKKTWQAKGKRERNFAILFQQLESAPTEPYHWQNLGRQYVHDGKHDQAMSAFDRAFALVRPTDRQQPWLAQMYLMATTSALATNDLAKGQQIVERGLSMFGDYGELWNHYGALLHASGQPREAIAAYERSRALHGVIHRWGTVDRAGTSWRPARNLAQAWLALGETVRAIEWFDVAVKEAPGHLALKLESAIPLAALGVPAAMAEAEKIVDDILTQEPGNVAALRVRAAFPQVRAFQQAAGG